MTGNFLSIMGTSWWRLILWKGEPCAPEWVIVVRTAHPTFGTFREANLHPEPRNSSYQRQMKHR